MVLGGRPPGRVGRRRICVTSAPAAPAPCAGAFVASGDREQRAGTLAAMPRSDDRGSRVAGAAIAAGASRQRPFDRRQPAAAAQARGDVREEIVRLGGTKGSALTDDQLMKAADAYSRDRARDALRLLRPLRDALPESPSVRELIGLAQYRLGHYPGRDQRARGVRRAQLVRRAAPGADGLLPGSAAVAGRSTSAGVS